MYMPHNSILKARLFAQILGWKILREAFHWLIPLSFKIQMCERLSEILSWRHPHCLHIIPEVFISFNKLNYKLEDLK